MHVRVGYVAFSFALAAILAGVILWAREPLLDYHARRLARALPAAPDVQVEPTLRRIAHLGRPGFRALLRQMESPREIVAQTATELVITLAEEWESGSPRQADALLADLMVHLANRRDSYPPSIRGASKTLALRVLKRPMLYAGRPRVEVFAACERLLQGPPRFDAGRTLEFDKNIDPPVFGRPVPTEQDEQVAENPGVRQAADWRDGVVESVASLPGGGLDRLPQLDRPASIGSGFNQDHTEGGGLPELLPPNRGATVLPVRNSRTEKECSPQAAENENSSGVRGLSAVEKSLTPAKPPETALATGLAKPRLYEVMRSYATGSGEEAAEAERRLVECGFRSIHLRLTKRLFHEDFEIRRTLARVLPDVPGVRAETWLLYLCHDKEPIVRETAMGMLLTLDNPKVIREAQRIVAGATNHDDYLQQEPY